MPFPSILGLSPATLGVAGIAGLAGAFPTPGSETSTPILSPQVLAMLEQMSNQYQHLSQTGTNLQPYASQQTQVINRNSDLQQQGTQEALAARGLSTSPIAATIAAKANQNRVGQINSLQASLPLLQHQMQLGDLAAESQFAASVPHGVQKKTSQGGGIGGFLGGLGGILGNAVGAATLSDKNAKENIADTSDGLAKILAMKPKEFNYKGSPEVHSGFIAQDLEKLFPSVVQTEPNSGLKEVKYHELIPKIVAGMQELHETMGTMMKEAKAASKPKKVVA